MTGGNGSDDLPWETELSEVVTEDSEPQHTSLTLSDVLRCEIRKGLAEGRAYYSELGDRMYSVESIAEEFFKTGRLLAEPPKAKKQRKG